MALWERGQCRAIWIPFRDSPRACSKEALLGGVGEPFPRARAVRACQQLGLSAAAVAAFSGAALSTETDVIVLHTHRAPGRSLHLRWAERWPPAVGKMSSWLQASCGDSGKRGAAGQRDTHEVNINQTVHSRAERARDARWHCG